MAKRSPFKKDRLEADLRDKINVLLRRDFSDPDLKFVTVTKVELTNDLGYASVFWDTFDPAKRQAAEKVMNKVQGKIRSMLGPTSELRHIPEIRCFYDSQYVEEERITKILDAEKERIVSGDDEKS